MAANRRDPPLKFLGIPDVVTQHLRNDKVLQDMPGSTGGFIGVARVLVGYALAEAGSFIGMNFDKNTFTVHRPTEGGLEWGLERHAQVVEGYPRDFHEL
jgi:hypothetical protein